MKTPDRGRVISITFIYRLYGRMCCNVRIFLDLSIETSLFEEPVIFSLEDFRINKMDLVTVRIWHIILMEMENEYEYLPRS